MSAAQKRLIIEYWFRVLISDTFNFEDIAKCIADLAAEFEQFDSTLIHEHFQMYDEYQKASLNWQGFTRYSVFGVNIATEGRKYYWKIELCGTGGFRGFNIGVIEANKAKEHMETGWWGRSYGYSWYQNGQVFNKKLSGGNKQYGQSYGRRGDIIHVWLDMKENGELSFGKNERRYGKAFDIDCDKRYRLCVACACGEFKLLEFMVEY